VTRNATIEALFRYPSPPPDRLFPWLRETISWRALDQLRSELSDLETTVYNAAEAEALQAALADLDQVDPPAMGEAAGLREWRRGFRLRSLYETVEAFYDESAVRQACTAAVGRLPRRQAEVIDGLFFQDHTAQQLAIQRDVSRNTIYNTSAHAKRNLHEDDCFFAALYQLGIVRDRARAAGLAARYPSGRLPDGRRIVSIDRAA
jgi:DNA-directed RNA polymerase specialized sigma24 family protein